MREILLSQNKTAFVDDADYLSVSQFKWSAVYNGHGMWYAVRSVLCSDGKYHLQLMHHFILGTKVLHDHKDRNGCNNQRDNLRQATNSQNRMNQKHHSTALSLYKGVSWHSSMNKWRVLITVDGKEKHVGEFVSELEAARAYDIVAKQYYGEFAVLNGV